MSRLQFLSVVFCVFWASVSFAQPTPSALTLTPFPDKAIAETYDQPIFQNGGHAHYTTGNGDRSGGIVWYDSFGRIRFDRDGSIPFDIGYRYLYVDVNAGTAVIPANELHDISLGAGTKFTMNGGDQVGLIAGIGYAGDKPFQDANGTYGIGHVTYQHKLDEHNAVVFSLDYNGNGELLPDVPLPGIGWNHTADKFDYLIGFPESAARLSLTDNLELRAAYEMPYTANVDLEYRFTRNIAIYGQAAHFFHGFELSHQSETNRLFEEMTRVELGVRLIYGDLVDVSLAGGYALDQDFYRGWDVRHVDRIARFTDEPYLGFIVRGRF